jgi:hypothetical protein
MRIVTEACHNVSKVGLERLTNGGGGWLAFEPQLLGNAREVTFMTLTEGH